MLIIFGVNFAKDKKLIHALPKLYGIGAPIAKKICEELSLAPQLRVGDLTDAQQFEIAKKIKEEFRIEENLREIIKNNIHRSISNGSLKGFRHKHHLPVRGQRTHTNAKTVRRVILGMSANSKR